MKLTIKKQAGLALLELILAVVVIVIAIGVLVSVQSSDDHTRQEVALGNDLSIFLNHVLSYSEEYVKTTDPFVEKNFADLELIASELGISSNYIDQLKSKGIVSANLVISFGGSDQDECLSANDCHGNW